MNSAGAKGSKRARTDDDQQQSKCTNDEQPRGRPQLLLNTMSYASGPARSTAMSRSSSPHLAHGLIRRVMTIAVEVRL